MYDTSSMLLTKVPITLASTAGDRVIGWFDARGLRYVSVKARVCSGGTAWSSGVLELVYDVFDQSDPKLWSSSKELTSAAPEQIGIDTLSGGIPWVGVRVKTAESNVELDIQFYGAADNGTGSHKVQKATKYSPL